MKDMKTVPRCLQRQVVVHQPKDEHVILSDRAEFIGTLIGVVTLVAAGVFLWLCLFY